MAKLNSKTMPRSIQVMIAGPGAGKTFQMVERIGEKLHSLNPQRCMAVITYTNDAAQLIQDRLRKRYSVPGNVFIGTIHSFLNRFVLIPHGRLTGVLPGDVKFIDNVVISPGRKITNVYANQIKAEFAIKKKAREAGYVTYGDIETLARCILTDKKANPNCNLTRQAVANRLEYIFVDEYQDATDVQHKILIELLKEGTTTLYCVGDPEQYIYGFSYRDKHRTLPCFKNLPIMDMAVLPGQSLITNVDNRRSTQKIIDLLNRLNTQVQQVIAGDIGERSRNLPVHFLPETSETGLCTRFATELVRLGFEEESHQQLIVAADNKLVDRLAVGAKCGRISNDQMPSRGILLEALRFIAGILGRSQREIRELKGFSLLAWRDVGFKFVEALRQQVNPQLDDAKKLAERFTVLPAIFRSDFMPSMEDSFGKLLGWSGGRSTSNKACSTIHKAKGLEADAVLVVADSRRELKRWLETDQTKRFSDKKDECRVGFVAFSRARLLLAIGCLEPLDDDLKSQLRSMAIEMV